MGLLYICQFGMCGFIKPDQWEGAQALYIPGIYGTLCLWIGCFKLIA